MKRVLITGSTGFLGKHLTKRLCASGYNVLALNRAPVSHFEHFGDNYRSCLLPNPELSDLIRALKDIDVVCHLAAFIPINHSDPSSARQCLETNALFLLSMLQASIANRVGRFIYFSAGNAYAGVSNTPAKETFKISPALTSPFYLGSKILGEIFVEYYRQRYDLETISLRISTPYGMGMPIKSVVMSFIRSTLQGLPLQVHDGGRWKTDFVFAEDVVNATVAAIEGGPPGVYNIGSGVTSSILQLAHTVSEVFDKQASIEVLPPAAKINKGFRPLDIKKAIHTWNWKPRPLKDGVDAMKLQIENDNGLINNIARSGKMAPKLQMRVSARSAKG